MAKKPQSALKEPQSTTAVGNGRHEKTTEQKAFDNDAGWLTSHLNDYGYAGKGRRFVDQEAARLSALERVEKLEKSGLPIGPALAKQIQEARSLPEPDKAAVEEDKASKEKELKEDLDQQERDSA